MSDSSRIQRPEIPKIDRYRLIAELGRGGMADVYLAVAAGPGGFSKLLVIKQLRASDDPTLIAMFLDEAKLAARVSHQNVVQTYEVVHEPETQRAYMVMEFLDGPSLSRLRRVAVKKGQPVPLALELLILREALTGLHAAHELKAYDGTSLNVVHRDFTPQNLMVTYAGEVKIVDFGIAKALDQQAQTSVGYFKGKLTYVPPEQLMGHAVDRRADIFAAGIVLYEAITGDSPWKGLTNAAITHALATGNIPRLLEYVGAPPELAAICDQAMAVDPDSRYSTALEFREAVDQFIADQKLRVDHVQLGQYVSSILDDAKEKSREVIEAQMKLAMSTSPSQLVSLPVLEGVTPSPPAKVLGRSLPLLMASTAMPDTGAGVAQPITQHTLGAGAKLIVGLFGALILLLVALVGWLIVRAQPGGPVAVAPSSAAPERPPTPRPGPPPVKRVEAVEVKTPPAAVEAVDAEPMQVQARIRVNPAGAVITLDDRVLNNPFTGAMPLDTEPHQLRVTAPGYDEVRRRVDLNRDLEVDLTLNRTVHERTAIRPVRKPPLPEKALPPGKPAEATEDPEYFSPTAPKQPKRALESDIDF